MFHPSAAASARVFQVLVLASCLLGSVCARALTGGQTVRGEAFVMGGVGDDERSSMRQGRKKFSLWVQTGVNGGADLSGAEVSVTTSGGNPVLAVHLNGPWLFIQLGPGEYLVAVTAGGRTEARRAMIHRGDHTEMVFFFDEPVAGMPPPGRTQP